MRLIIAFLSLLLSGCWVGSDFYAAADLRQPIPTGEYQSTELTRGVIGDGRLRIVHRSDGYVTATPIDAEGREDHGDASIIGFAQLDADGRLFVAWQLMGESGAPANERSYALLRREQSGAFTVLLPRCEGRSAEVARTAGATARIDPDPAYAALSFCIFSSRAQLEAGLRAVEPHVLPMMRLTPLPR